MFLCPFYLKNNTENRSSLANNKCVSYIWTWHVHVSLTLMMHVNMVWMLAITSSLQESEGYYQGYLTIGNYYLIYLYIIY